MSDKGNVRRSGLTRASLSDDIPSDTQAIVVIVPSPAPKEIAGITDIPACFTGAAGSTVTVYKPTPVVLAGCGALPESGVLLGSEAGSFETAVRKAASSGIDAAVGSIPSDAQASAAVAVDLSALAGDAADALAPCVVHEAVLSSYAWDMHVTAADDSRKKKRASVCRVAKGSGAAWGAGVEDAAKRAAVVAEGVAFARDANETRAGEGSVAFYCDVAERICAESDGKLTAEVLRHEKLLELGCGAICAVGQGHPDGSALVLIDYNGDPSSERRTALVGKGVVFDTGGQQVKPTPGIETMYMDMCGAGTALAAVRTLARLGSKCNVTAVLCLAENSIGATTFHPSDILVSYKGLTIEVGHTDAEGRLCLADGLAYVERHRSVTEVVDIATLTGASIVALGFTHAGLFSFNDDMCTRLVKATEGTRDRLWRLPLVDEHVDLVKAKKADLSNLGKGGRNAGASTAAAFLSRFVDTANWAHLDIAGPASQAGTEVGATGFGVHTLIQFCEN